MISRLMIDLWETPALTFVQEEDWSLSVWGILRFPSDTE